MPYGVDFDKQLHVFIENHIFSMHAYYIDTMAIDTSTDFQYNAFSFTQYHM